MRCSSVSPWERRDYVAQELRPGPHLHRRRRRARMLADRRHRHAHRARGGRQSRLEARRHGRRLGRTGAARLLRDRAAADRGAQCRAGDAILQRHRRHPRMARGRDGLEGQSGLAVGARAHQAAIRLRRLADLRAGRHAAGCRSTRRASCRRPGRGRARRMPGSTTTARRSTCSATASCCCGSAPSRPTRRA